MESVKAYIFLILDNTRITRQEVLQGLFHEISAPHLCHWLFFTLTTGENAVPSNCECVS